VVNCRSSSECSFSRQVDHVAALFLEASPQSQWEEERRNKNKVIWLVGKMFQNLTKKALQVSSTSYLRLCRLPLVQAVAEATAIHYCVKTSNIVSYARTQWLVLIKTSSKAFHPPGILRDKSASPQLPLVEKRVLYLVEAILSSLTCSGASNSIRY